jgi:hypothetical protein
METAMSTPLTSPRLEALRSAPLNSWIVLSEDESRVVASGATVEEVVKKCEEAGIADPILIKTPPEWLPFAFASRS